jgi:NAD(P)-dependent dehydrogenase (short-subunit alcohol dehydrogenase family)
MLIENKNAVIYGGGGAIGGAVARAFAREGAKVFLAGRTRPDHRSRSPRLWMLMPQPTRSRVTSSSLL